MIENREVAEAVSKKLTSAFDSLGESILLVNKSSSEEEARQFREIVGDAFYLIVFKLLEPIYATHPDLKPPDWTERL